MPEKETPIVESTAVCNHCGEKVIHPEIVETFQRKYFLCQSCSEKLSDWLDAWERTHEEVI